MTLPADLLAQIDEAITHYPADKKRAASLPLLHLWQEHFGFIADEAVAWIAEKLGLGTNVELARYALQHGLVE